MPLRERGGMVAGSSRTTSLNHDRLTTSKTGVVTLGGELGGLPLRRREVARVLNRGKGALHPP
jgi:hypothetical protein